MNQILEEVNEIYSVADDDSLTIHEENINNNQAEESSSEASFLNINELEEIEAEEEEEIIEILDGSIE